MSRLIIFGILLVTFSLGFAENERPLVGAIRWDAWSGGSITEQVERTLGPKKYHNRLPWFAEVKDENTVKINGGRQEIMDREIEFATTAGLNYWAFLIYQEDNSMSTALKLYLKSNKRKQINFCMILHNTLNSSKDMWPIERDRAIALLQEPCYQTVLDGHPLVYAFIGGNFPFDRFQEFLTEAKKKKLNPYCVFMGWNPTADFKKVSNRGFEAVSAYARGGSEAKFSELVEAVEKSYWQNAAKSKTPYVPMVTTGWDKWPRKDNHVSWEKGQAYHKQKVFPSRATPAEISAHLQNAISFVRKHPEICKANSIIIYAWNEYDEGGWLAPTRSPDGTPDNSRLDAIQTVLKKEKETQKPR